MGFAKGNCASNSCVGGGILDAPFACSTVIRGVKDAALLRIGNDLFYFSFSNDSPEETAMIQKPKIQYVGQFYVYG
ncbi:MAG: hypothetical protein ACI4PH_07070, partial [Faecousia sp.]